MPEQKAPAVTFDSYVIPETVQAFEPPAPAAPVHFAPTPQPVSKLAQTQTVMAAIWQRLEWNPLTKAVAVVAFFILGAFTGYLLSGGTGAAVADLGTSQVKVI